MKEFSFSGVDLQEIRKITNSKRVFSQDKFEEWFSYESKISESDREFLLSILERYGKFFRTYSEDTLKAKFLTPILNRVDFFSEELDISDFYHEKLTYQNEQFKLNGFCDFYVAGGLDIPDTPYFFIQEFKKTVGSNPEAQLIAELIAGLELSNSKFIRGAFIVGAIWNFVVLWKEKDGYLYQVSNNFDSTEPEKLVEIYENLLFVKDEIFDLVKKGK
jgi:hypothetical protein